MVICKMTINNRFTMLEVIVLQVSILTKLNVINISCAIMVIDGQINRVQKDFFLIRTFSYVTGLKMSNVEPVMMTTMVVIMVPIVVTMVTMIPRVMMVFMQIQP